MRGPRPNRRTKAWAGALVAVTGLTTQLFASPPASAESPPERTELAPGMAGVHGEVTRLYLALLDRAPEDDGLDYWVSQRQGGASLRAMVAFFRTSPEFESRFGHMVDASTEAWVDFIYQQVLGRTSDAEGRAFWIEFIESGSASKEDLIIHFSESPEFQEITGTGIIGFLHLVDESRARYTAGSYRYTADSSSYWRRAETTITVRNGVVVERSFEEDWSWDGSIDESWVETGDDVGSHEAGEPAHTVEDVHDACVDRLQTLDPTAHWLTIEVDELGRMTMCGGHHLMLADATDPMVEIGDYVVLEESS